MTIMYLSYENFTYPNEQILHKKELTILRPPEKSAYLRIKFAYFSTKTHVVVPQKNRLNETVLLSTQNTC